MPACRLSALRMGAPIFCRVLLQKFMRDCRASRRSRYALLAVHAALAALFVAAPKLLVLLTARTCFGLSSALLVVMVIHDDNFRYSTVFPSPPCSPAHNQSDEDKITCPSCGKADLTHHGFRTHLGSRPPCKRA